MFMFIYDEIEFGICTLSQKMTQKYHFVNPKVVSGNMFSVMFWASVVDSVNTNKFITKLQFK